MEHKKASQVPKHVFEHYKKRLLKGCHEGRVRFNVIEYLTSFPGINPYEMAASLSLDGVPILFDDSSISPKENKQKEDRVKLIARNRKTSR